MKKVELNTPQAIANLTGLPLSDVLDEGPKAVRFVDALGREQPPEQWYGPGHVYVGSLSRGRVCWTPSGQKWKVLRQGEGSTLIRPFGGTKKTIGARTFEAPHEPYTVARSTVVRVTKEQS